MISKLRCGAFVLCLLAPFTADAAAILHVVDGKLQGASGVEVQGSLYDVAFRQGSCASIFSGCDDASDFPFLFSEGTAASRALLEQVFVDTAGGAFDSDPSLTAGCESALDHCYALVPAGLSIFTGPNGPFVVIVGALNAALEGNDRVWPVGEVLDPTFPAGYVGGRDGGGTWAVWTPQSAQVPEPTTLGLLVGSTLVTLGLRRRRRRL